MQTWKKKLLKPAGITLAILVASTLSLPALAEGQDSPAEDVAVETTFAAADNDAENSALEEWAEEQSEEGDQAASEDPQLPPADVDEDIPGPEDPLQANALLAVDALLPTASSYAELASEIAAISVEGSILLTGDFPLDAGLVIDGGKEVTLLSLEGAVTLTIQAGRHFTVNDGSLVLQNVVLDGENTAGGIHVTNGDLYLGEGAVITRCYHSSGGGAVRLENGSEMVMEGGEVSHSQTHLSSGVNGGGISVVASSLRLLYGTIHNNASVYGGGVALLEGSTMVMEEGKIHNNRATSGSGGGVDLGSGTSLTMYGGVIEHNTAPSGGGVSLGVGTYTGPPPAHMSFTMYDGLIQHNVANSTGGGGGIAAQFQGRVEIAGGRILYNKAEVASGVVAGGGGIAMTNPSDAGMRLTITGGEIAHNDSAYGEGGGGGVWVYGQTAARPINVTIGAVGTQGPSIHDNEADFWGGGMALEGDVVVDMYSGSISGNTVYAFTTDNGCGGGIAVMSGATFTMHDGSVARNESKNYGGGLGMRQHWGFAGGNSTTVSILGGHIEDNTALYGGGLSQFNSGVLTLDNTVVSGNTARNGGGVYWNGYTRMFVQNGTQLVNNHATGTGTNEGEGGAIYDAGTAPSRKYAYVPSPPDYFYQEIYTDNTTIFRGNTAASGLFLPPVNHTAFHWFEYAESSLEVGGSWLHLLNNYDINYMAAGHRLVSAIFDGNGGTIGGEEAVMVGPGQAGDEISVSDVEDLGTPSRPGATFMGWADNDGNLAADAVTFPYQLEDADKTFYAIWEVNYTVTHLDRDTGETLGTADGHAPEGSLVDPGYLSAGALPARYRTHDKTGADTPLAFTGADNEIAYRYVRQFTVQLNANGGSFAPGASTSFVVDRGDSLAEGQLPAVTHPDGQLAEGWYVATGPGAGASAFAGGAYTVTADATLAVAWAGFAHYTVRHINLDDGSVIEAAGHSAPVGSAVTHAPFEQTAQYTPVSTAPLTKTIAKEGTGVDNSFTFYYTLRSYSVTFHDTLLGQDIRVDTVPYGAKASAPAPGTHTGYSFTGWYRDAAGSAAWDFDTETITGDVTLYARWQPVTTPVTPPSSSASPSSSTPSRASSYIPPASSAPPASEQSSTPAPAVSSLPASNSTTGTVIEPEPPADTVGLPGGGIPLGGFGTTGTWALVNLILALVAALVGVFNLIRWVVKKDDVYYDGEGEPIVSQKHKNLLLVTRCLSVACALLVGVAFLLLENLSLPVSLLNKNTLVILLLCLLQPVAIAVAHLVWRGKLNAEQQLQAQGDAEMQQWLEQNTGEDSD